MSRYFLAPIVAVGGLSFKLNDRKQVAHCDKHVMNNAFVFIKPHANTKNTQDLVANKFKETNIKVLKTGTLTGEQIDKDKLIDQHYYAIASKATLMKPLEMPVPVDKFKEAFGVSWEEANSNNLVFNALDACNQLGVDAMGLDKLWAKAKKVKFGGGFYCGLVEAPGKKPIYVFNGFFMEMRSKFVTPGTSITYYVVEFCPNNLSWSDFRGKVLGPTDPKEAPVGSLRASVLSDWQKLGLKDVPNVGDNGIHASASPFEGLAERMNWLHSDIATDSFGKELIAAGITADTIKKWSIDPQVKGKSLFDQLEDLDASACIKKAVELSK